MNMNRNMDISRNMNVNMDMKKNKDYIMMKSPLTRDSHQTPPTNPRGNWASAPRPWKPKPERGGRRPNPQPHPSHSALGRKGGLHGGYDDAAKNGWGLDL